MLFNFGEIFSVKSLPPPTIIDKIISQGDNSKYAYSICSKKLLFCDQFTKLVEAKLTMFSLVKNIQKSLLINQYHLNR